MKKTLILISVLCFFNKAFTQDYTQMLELGKIWNMYVHYDTSGGYYFDLEVTETVEINGLMYYHIEASHNNCDVFLREDISENKIYGIWQGVEYLYYDFSLSVGDSVVINGQSHEITAIEYGDFFGMLNLRYFVLDNFWNLVEGIGLDRIGLGDTFEYGCLNNPPWEYIELIGMNQPLGIDDISLNNITLFPNPVLDVLSIQSYDQLNIKNITVYDILGKVLLIEENNFKQIDLSMINSGILLVMIETDNRYVIKKIIKK